MTKIRLHGRGVLGTLLTSLGLAACQDSAHVCQPVAGDGDSNARLCYDIGDFGESSLAISTPEPAGENCPQGGQRIDTGFDDNDNGLLDANEVEGSAYICDGLLGPMGLTALTVVTAEPAGSSCAAGGVRVDYGVDTDADGALQAAEVQGSEYVCHGEGGPTGQAGAAGASGPTGPAGLDGQDGADGADGQDGADGVDGDDGQDGATGATGDPGPAGATGATGVADPTPIEPRFTPGTFVSSGANVVFDTVVYSAGNISYNAATGVVTFNEAGRYIIDWWVSVDGIANLPEPFDPDDFTKHAVFALSSSQGDFLEGNLPSVHGQVVGVGIVEVVAAPVTLSLVNAGAHPINYSSVTPLKATLTVVEHEGNIALQSERTL